jgi:Domain of unknown function (DUF1883)
MQFLHSEFTIGSDSVIQVTLDKQANVRLLDDTNFTRYRSGGRYTFHGGRAVKSPVHLSPPHYGRWHVVVDLGGHAGSVRASIGLL